MGFIGIHIDDEPPRRKPQKNFAQQIKEILRVRIEPRPRKQKRIVLPTEADPIFIRLLNDIDLAKRTERELWKRLARYLATGEDQPPRKRVRIDVRYLQE